MIGDRIRSKTLCDIVSHPAIEFIRYQGHVLFLLYLPLSMFITLSLSLLFSLPLPLTAGRGDCLCC